MRHFIGYFYRTCRRFRPSCSFCSSREIFKRWCAFRFAVLQCKSRMFSERAHSNPDLHQEINGQKIILTSGFRPHSGREGSQHRHCNAADIRVTGVSDEGVIAIAKKAPGIGGIGRYCNGIIHVDIGPKRTWTDCGKKLNAAAHGRRHHNKQHSHHK